MTKQKKQAFYFVEGLAYDVPPKTEEKTDWTFSLVGDCELTFLSPVIVDGCCVKIVSKGISAVLLPVAEGSSFAKLFIAAGAKEQVFSVSVVNNTDCPQEVSWQGWQVSPFPPVGLEDEVAEVEDKEVETDAADEPLEENAVGEGDES